MFNRNLILAIGAALALVQKLNAAPAIAQDAALAKRAVKTKIVYETVVIAVDQHNNVITDFVLKPTPALDPVPVSEETTPIQNDLIKPIQQTFTSPNQEKPTPDAQETQNPVPDSQFSTPAQETYMPPPPQLPSVIPETPSTFKEADAVVPPEPTLSAVPTETPQKSEPKAPSASQKDVKNDSMATGDFVDGKIPCSQFPAFVDGVVRVDWLNMSGWSSIRPAQGGSGSECLEGSHCSYACRPGMLKYQWPADQPSTGESIGGLLCNNGMLYRTRPDRPLCGDGANTAFIKSDLDKGAFFCQTDYPGSENMDIKTFVPANGQTPVSVVKQSDYYNWQGRPTSGQFYIQNKGNSVERACVWGEGPSGDYGNWSPAIAGISQTDDGTTWLAIGINPLARSDVKLNYNIEILAAQDGQSSASIDCTYIDGVIRSGGASGLSGCTVACKGSCYYHLY